ncbi:MAG TPA: CRTAC1 family protein [Gemmataceae bacterium]|nr:CRTAC1 family protein [Gemmataceae bacterium]
MIHRRRPYLAAILFGVSAALTAGCRPPAPSGPDPAPPTADAGPTEPEWFEDVTDQVGIDFHQDPGPLGHYFMPEIIGSGGALFDFDGDGLLDVLLLQSGGPQSGSKNKLCKQLRDGRFQDVSAGSGLDFAGWSCGVAVGDVNNDGWPDVLITQYGGVKLFLNHHGDGTFTDVTKEAGLDAPGWCTSAAFFDYDRDGRLDLVVVRYLDYEPSIACPGPGGSVEYCNPNTFKGLAAVLYHNVTGSDRRPRFEDVTGPSGLGRLPGPGLGVLCADFNGDGWPDIFVANDGKPNHLWINQKNGTFREEAVRRGVAYNGMGAAQAGMGVALGDVDGDGMEDLFVTHLGSETNALWMQGPRGLFRDRTGAAGLAQPSWRATGFGTALADFNLDGALDAVVLNGRVTVGPTAAAASYGLGPHWSKYAERNQLFTGDGAGHFRELSPSQSVLCGSPNMGRGLTVGDVNGDGAPDLLTTTIGGKARLLRNRAPNRGHWLAVRALYPDPDRDAVGAVVTVWSGDRHWIRRADPCSGFLCSGDPRALFGLGKAETVDRIEVLWPNGTQEQFPGGPVDRVLELRQTKGAKKP